MVSENTDLIADIGGTNARFALLTEAGEITKQITLPCADFPGPVEAITEYLSRTNGKHPHRACLSVACPTGTDHLSLTNNHWAFSVEETRKATGLEQLHMINDFTAQTLAIPHIPISELIQVGGGKRELTQTMAALGPGTGLGVGGILPTRHGWQSIDGEGGHAPFAPTNDYEMEIWLQLRQSLDYITSEHLLSGTGIVRLYNAIAALEGTSGETVSAAQITERGVTGQCQTCQTTLNAFCGMLGTFANSVALTMGARGGVYIGGGIVPRFSEFFVSSEFRKRFESGYPNEQYLSEIPCFIVMAQNPALLGLRHYLQNL